MTRTSLRAAASLVAVLALSGCVATGPQPDVAIPPALLQSDLDILEAEAGKSLSGTSLTVWASFVVERDVVSADDLREVLRIVVANTHLTNIHAISIIGLSDELESFQGSEQNVYLDLVPAADELGLPDPDDGLGTIVAEWDDVIRMLEDTE